MALFLIILTGLVTVGFLINIPFFIIWAKKQRPNEELELYFIRGKFTYLNVVRQITLIENEVGLNLKKERKKVSSWFSYCQKRKKPFKGYEKKVHRMLKDAAFGKPMLVGSWRKMEIYSRIVAVWDLLIPILILNCFSSYLYLEDDADYHYLTAGVVGHLMGVMFAAPVWGFCHLMFNIQFRRVARKWMKQNKRLTYMQEIMAEFWGITAGMFWIDDAWNEYGRIYSDASSIRYSGGISVGGFSGGGSFGGFGGFGGGSFGGGGAGGSW